MVPDLDDLVSQGAALLQACRAAGLTLAAAESCTGGLIAAVLTEVPGASDVVERGFVVYSNRAKTDLLGVAPGLIEAHGAVSEAVARAMAVGALDRSPADLAVSVTGVAGPGGGTPGKPVGLVHLAAARRDGMMTHRELRLGDVGRSAIRRASVREAFALISSLIRSGG